MTRTGRALAGALLLGCAGCAHSQPLGQVRDFARSPGGMSTISLGAGLAEGIFRFDLQLLEWTFGPKGKAP